MRMVGYTDDEHEEIYRIDEMKDPQEKEEQKKHFEERTGKEFPKIIFKFNVDTAFPKISDEELGKWMAEGYPGGYKSGARRF
jgi:hypothetical protein